MRTLRALVVLPTRGLAVQVHAVLHALGARAGLRVELAAAQESVAAEGARLLVAPGTPDSGPDVLVATPGRLMAHLTGTPGFGLACLRWLVVDEADRLLRQDYQGWLPHVLAAAAAGGVCHPALPCDTLLTSPMLLADAHGGSSSSSSDTLLPLLSPPPLLPYGAGGELAAGAGRGVAPGRRLIKLVVSATLTRDPGKLLRFELTHPRFITLADAARRYGLPPRLEQHRVVAAAAHKPLALLALLRRLAGTAVVVFASSLHTTHRLRLLLDALPGPQGQAVEYSGALAPPARAAALAAFTSRDATVLVTTDAMARGMDLPIVGAVINYDPPSYPKAYVHRAGRTARAGAAGAVYTLLQPEEVAPFNALCSKLAGGRPHQLRLNQDELTPLRDPLHSALQQVAAALQAEEVKDAANTGIGAASTGAAKRRCTEGKLRG